MKKTILSAFAACILFIWPCTGPGAVNISPELLPHLSSSEQSESEERLIVLFSGRPDLHSVTRLPGRERRLQMVKHLRGKAEQTHGPFMTFLKSQGVHQADPLWMINGVSVIVPRKLLRKIAAFPGVSDIRTDRVVTLAPPVETTSDDPEWNARMIDATKLWDLGFRGQGVVVANVDTGVDLDHPDLKSRWRGGNNSWYDPYGRHALPFDANGHGTKTMGIMVGSSLQGVFSGVAPKAQWIAARIFDDNGEATVSRMHMAMQWLLDPDGDPQTDDAPHVVNCSWGFVSPDSCLTDFERDIQILKAAGIAVVFSAGNEGPSPSTSASPANNRNVFSVGAVDSNRIISGFSSRGPSSCDATVFPTVVAPGHAVRTTTLSSGGRQGSYAVVSGTSFAAPHAAASMALLLSAYPGLRVQDLEAVLVSSATDLGVSGPDNDYGNGLINVSAAHTDIKSSLFSVALTSMEALDGWVRESADGSRKGGAVVPNSNIVIGDDAQNRQIRAILSFDTSTIPQDAVITSATLTLRARAFRGNNPFLSHNACVVDMKSGAFGGPALQGWDFQVRADARRVTVLSRVLRPQGYSRGVLNPAGLKGINRGGLTQFRLSFGRRTNGDHTADQVIFHGDGAPWESRPTIHVTYRLP